ncbi:MAG: preprotein translocase subunit SecY [Candidatus Bipolaricaulia bacterium]
MAQRVSLWRSTVQAFSIPEVKKRALFTLGAIIVFRIGAWIPVPGVDLKAFASFFQGFGGGIFGFLNMFSGGALENFSLFALGVVPYINASIIFSLLVPIIPRLKELQQQGEEGQKIITRWTRYATVLLAIIQALGYSVVIVNQGLLLPGQPIIPFYLTSLIAMVAGTIFLMWLGERITENGIGNGISMIIMLGIISRFPAYVQNTYLQISTGSTSPFWALALIIVFIVVTAGIVLVQLGARRVEVQYAKRIVQGRVYGGQSTYLPIAVNQGGVIPIIFAAALLALPLTVINFIPGWQWLRNYVDQGTPAYLAAYAILIIFFTYFYSAIVFDPRDVAENLRKWGGFIPGIRPGRYTSDYISRVINRVLLIGALFLTAIAILPYLIIGASGISGIWIGGTSLLIVVGVGVDMMKQIEAHMVERQYESLIKKGAVLGRRL